VEVQVRLCRVSGVTEQPEDLAALDALAFGDLVTLPRFDGHRV